MVCYRAIKEKKKLAPRATDGEIGVPRSAGPGVGGGSRFQRMFRPLGGGLGGRWKGGEMFPARLAAPGLGHLSGGCRGGL